MKSAARFYVVQALFQMEAINQDLNEIKEEFENFRIGAELDGIKYNDADKKYFRGDAKPRAKSTTKNECRKAKRNKSKNRKRLVKEASLKLYES